MATPSSSPTAHSHPPHSQLQLPSPLRQLSYFSTGCLAGAASLPISSWPKLLPSTPLATTTILRTGIRFWTFDQTRHILRPLHLPVWLSGAFGGASGGFTEILLSSLARRQLPTISALGSQTSRLFFCFGTYTFLSTEFSERQPPKPFWKCWVMGALAGATGSAVVGFWEGYRGRVLWRGVVPRGALTIGTVISVQVSSCAKVLETVGA